MKFLRIVFSAIALIGLILPAGASVPAPTLADHLKDSLVNCSTAEDSLRVLLDIYDLSDDERPDVARQVLALAEKVDRQEVIVDFLLQMSILFGKDDSMLRSLIIEAENIHNINHRKGVQLYVNVMRVINEVSYVPDSEFHKSLLEYARADMMPADDIYQDILDLCRVVAFLGKSAKDNLYLEYITRLENKIRKLPDDHFYIRHLLYTTLALNHTLNNNVKKAIEADRELIEVIGKLERNYRKSGRRYRNCDHDYYASYCRMLRNYKGLTLDEVKSIYTKCAALAEKNDDLRVDFYDGGCPTVYRLMAERRYQEVIPRIKSAMEKNDDVNIRRELLRHLVEASDSVNDNATLLTALRDYNSMLQNQLDRKSEEAYRELQIRYDINNLKKEKSRLELEKRDSELRFGQKLVTLTLSSMLVLAVLLMILYRRHFNLRRKSHDLKDENERMRRYMEEFLDDGTPSDSLDLRKEGDDSSHKV